MKANEWNLSHSSIQVLLRIKIRSEQQFPLPHASGQKAINPYPKPTSKSTGIYTIVEKTCPPEWAEENHPSNCSVTNQNDVISQTKTCIF